MMPPEARQDFPDVEGTLEFAHTRASAQRFFPYPFVGLLVEPRAATTATPLIWA